MIHDQPEQAHHDVARQDHLAAYGYPVIRFRNDEVLADLPGVLARIAAAVQGRTSRSTRQGD